MDPRPGQCINGQRVDLGNDGLKRGQLELDDGHAAELGERVGSGAAICLHRVAPRDDGTGGPNPILLVALGCHICELQPRRVEPHECVFCFFVLRCSEHLEHDDNDHSL